MTALALGLAVCGAAADPSSLPDQARPASSDTAASGPRHHACAIFKVLPAWTLWELTEDPRGGAPPTRVEDRWDRAYRVAYGGLLFGLPGDFTLCINYEIPFSHYQNARAEQWQAGVVLELGVVIRLGQHAALEIGFPLGAGFTGIAGSWTVARGVVYEVDAIGTYAEGALVLRPAFHFDRLVAFVEGGLISNTATYNGKDGIGALNGTPLESQELKITTNGPFAGLGIGYAF